MSELSIEQKKARIKARLLTMTPEEAHALVARVKEEVRLRNLHKEQSA